MEGLTQCKQMGQHFQKNDIYPFRRKEIVITTLMIDVVIFKTKSMCNTKLSFLNDHSIIDIKHGTNDIYMNS